MGEGDNPPRERRERREGGIYMLHEYVDLFRLRLPINPREQTFAQMPPPSLVRIKEEKAVGEHLAGFTGAFSPNSTFHSIGGKNSRWRRRGSIQMRLAVRTLEYVRAPFSSASFECSALDLSPARTRSRTTLDNITKVRGVGRGPLPVHTRACSAMAK